MLFIEFHAGFDEQCSQLVGKRHLLVMLLLMLYVFGEPIFILRRMSKRSVSVLPMRKAWEDVVCLDPMGRCPLDFLHEVGEIHRRMHAGKNVQMICGPIDPVQAASSSANDSPHVSK